MELLIVIGFFVGWCLIGSFLAGLANMNDPDELIPAVLFWPMLLCIMIGAVVFGLGQWLHGKLK